jgi:transcriptional regulator with XRE-family HTH domain
MIVQLTERLSSQAAKVPNQIRYYRLKAGMTQRRLGRLVGKRRSVISDWERGKSFPTVPNLFRLAKALSTLGETLYAGLYCAFHPNEVNGKEEPKQ